MLIQRLGVIPEQRKEYIEDFIRTVKAHPGSCDEIWFATCYGYPMISTHKQVAGALVGNAELLRAAGIRVSMQVSNTLGHGEYMKTCDCTGLVFDGSPAANMVGHDGKKAAFAFCPHDVFFKTYLTDMLREYARVKPDVLWFDDDLRMDNHSPVKYGCFCDDCVARFNRQSGHTFDRASLVTAIHEDIEVRKQYVAYMRQTLYDFTYELASAFHEISPDTAFGLQNCEHNYTGYGLACIFDALHDVSGKAPAFRPGGGAYSDTDPLEIVDKYHLLGVQSRALPAYVTEIAPEIENTPDVYFGKTPAGTCLETAVYFAGGATAMTYAMLMNENEPLSFHETEFAAFEKQSRFFAALAALNRETKAGGVHYALSESGWLRRSARPFDFADYTFVTRLSDIEMTGIPFSLGKAEKGVFALRAENARLMSDEECDTLLHQNVFCDGASFRLMLEKGGFENVSAEPFDGSAAEYFDGHRWVCGAFSGADPFRCRIAGKDIVPLAVFRDDTGKELGASVAIVTTKYGAKWAVFGTDPWNGIISTARQKLIADAFDMITDGKVGARLETPLKCMMFVREAMDGRTAAVSLFNRTVGKAEDIVLRIRRPAGKTAYYMSQYDGETALEVCTDGEDMLVTVPALSAFAVGTVFVK